MRKLLSAVLFFAQTTYLLKAQNSTVSNNAIEMADGMRQSGKIYVVVAVMLIIFAGIAICLFGIEKRLRKLERETKIN